MNDVTIREEFNIVKECRYGKMIFNPSDRYIGRGFDIYGEFSEGEVELFRSIIKPGDHIVEVGANIGAHTIPLAKIAGLDGRVIAMEPQRVLFQTLCGNVALNSLMNVEALQVAVGAKIGQIIVPRADFRRPGNFGALELGTWRSGDQIPMVTIDSLQLNRCDLLKIDVEGMEAEVILGATHTISRLKPLLYVENDRESKQKALIWHIRNLGYSLWWHFPPLYNPENFFGNSENEFGEIVSLNMLCIPQGIPCPIDGLQPVE